MKKKHILVITIIFLAIIFLGHSDLRAVGNTSYGDGALGIGLFGNYNSAFGVNALLTNTFGSWNVGIGFEALFSNVTGSHNTAIGYKALHDNTDNSLNTATGSFALSSNIADNNTANGFDSLRNNTTGTNNTATGFKALRENKTASDNTADGAYALFSNTRGSENTANGYSALYSNQTGSYNTANGYKALYKNAFGGYNTANGAYALYNNTTSDQYSDTSVAYYDYDIARYGSYSSTTSILIPGTCNTANGYSALYKNTFGTNNTATGVDALYENKTGDNNTAIGYAAGYNNIYGSGNVFIGYKSGSNETGSNKLYIDNSDTDIPLIYGDFDTDRVGINENDPNYALDVNGNIGCTEVFEDSDVRFKKDITTIDNALNKVIALRGVEFEWRKDEYPEKDFAEGRNIGLIAQEVEEVLPEVVSTDNKGYKALKYDNIVGVLVEAIKAQQAQIETLQKRIAELENR